MNFIVAVSEDYAIGKNNEMLFNLPTDLKYFKEKTLNKVVVMGRKTFESIPLRPLKNRVNIVITTDLTFNCDGVIVVHSFEELFKKLENYNDEDIFIIGGSLGLDDRILKRADFKLSFSKMTFPHQMMRMVLLEQIYRAYRIMKNEPYHK